MNLKINSLHSYLPIEATREIITDIASHLFDRVQDLYAASLFIGSIVNSVKYLERTPQIANNLHVRKLVAINHYFMTYIDGLLLFLDLKNICTPDSKGRWIWQRHYPKIAEQLGWTVSHSFDFADFLDYLEIVNLSKNGAGLVSLGSAVFKVVACTFGIWESIRSIVSQERKLKKAVVHRKEWVERSKAWPSKQADCFSKIAHFQASTKPNAKRLKAKWVMLQKCEDPQKIEEFCKKAAARDLSKFEKCKNKQTRSAIGILFCVSLIALVALGLTVHFTGIGHSYPAMIGMVALPVAFTTADLGMLIVFKFITVPKVPKLKTALLLN